MPALSVVGGGISDAANVAFDLNRTKMRLEGLSSYGVISVLLMSCALRLYTSVPKKIRQPNDDEYNKIENIVTIMFSAVTIIGILSGFNTAIIFALLNLYSKTALGMGDDQAFVALFQSTASVRALGFETMVCSLFCLKMSFVMSVFLYFKGKVRYYLSSIATVVSLVSFGVWMSLIRKASILF